MAHLYHEHYILDVSTIIKTILYPYQITSQRIYKKGKIIDQQKNLIIIIAIQNKQLYLDYNMKYTWFLSIFNYLSDGSYPIEATKVIKQKIRRHSSKYKIQGENLYELSSDRMILHEAIEREYFLKIHNENHFGIKHLARMIKKNFVCDEVYAKSQAVVHNCITCQKRAREKHTRTNPSKPIRTPSQPFYLVGVDAIGPMQITARGNRYILTAIDQLTRWPVALAVPDINEITTVRFYEECLFPNYGVPNFILSDRGGNFISEYTTTYLSKLGCHGIHTTSFRPQCNGSCERLNQTLVSTIAKLARDDNKTYEWDRYVNPALMAIRTLENESTGYSPSQLLFGYQMITPAVWQKPLYGYEEGAMENMIAERIQFIEQDLKRIRLLAKEASDAAKQKYAMRYDKQVYPRRYAVGEQVLMKNFVPKTKFADKWIGPLTIVKANKNGTYYLEGLNSVKIREAVNGDVLKPFADAKVMIPDVSVTLAHQQFRSWISKKND